MSKDAMDRLADTVSFLKAQKTQTHIPAEQYKEVMNALQARVGAMSPVKKIKLSGLMSLDKAGKSRPGDETARKAVRGGVLLDLALVFPETEWDQKARLQVHLGGTDPWAPFEFAIARARDAVYSEPSMIRAMLSELRSHPLRVLRKYLITLDGGTKDGNPITYGVWMENGAYRFSCYGTGTRFQIKALNVRATAYRDVKDATGAVAPVDSRVADQCDLLFTTQFTGCAFCFEKSGNGQNILAAHIDPGKGQGAVSGSELSKIMRETGGFNATNGGGLRVYGRVPNNSDLPGYPESAGAMTIVGVRKGTDWRLYSQIKALNGSLVSAQRIDTVDKVDKFRR